MLRYSINIKNLVNLNTIYPRLVFLFNNGLVKIDFDSYYKPLTGSFYEYSNTPIYKKIGIFF